MPQQAAAASAQLLPLDLPPCDCHVLQAFLMRKLKIKGSMGMAMKLQPILDAAQPKAKL